MKTIVRETRWQIHQYIYCTRNLMTAIVTCYVGEFKIGTYLRSLTTFTIFPNVSAWTNTVHLTVSRHTLSPILTSTQSCNHIQGEYNNTPEDI